MDFGRMLPFVVIPVLQWLQLMFPQLALHYLLDKHDSTV